MATKKTTKTSKSPKAKSSKKNERETLATKKAAAKLNSSNSSYTKDKSEVEALANGPEKPSEVASSKSAGAEKNITLGELLLLVLVVGGIFLFGWRKAISIKNTAEDSAKYYKAEAMAAELDLYLNQKGHYPLESDIQDETWLKLNPRLEVLADDGYGNKIGSDMFKYTVYPEGCNNDTAQCDGFKLDIYSTSDDQTIQFTGGSGDNQTGSASDTNSSGAADSTNSNSTSTDSGD